MHYRFEVTPELAREAVEPLTRALWVQDERRFQQLSSKVKGRDRLRRVGALGCAAGVALCAWGWATARRGEMFIVDAAMFALLLLVFAIQPSLSASLRRVARRLIGFRARRIMEQVARKAPYQIDYSLDGGVLLAEIEKFKFSLPLPLQDVSVAVAAPRFICTFPRPYSTAKFRVLYVEAPEERAALIDALRGAGATLLEVP